MRDRACLHDGQALRERPVRLRRRLVSFRVLLRGWELHRDGAELVQHERRRVRLVRRHGQRLHQRDLHVRCERGVRLGTAVLGWPVRVRRHLVPWRVLSRQRLRDQVRGRVRTFRAGVRFLRSERRHVLLDGSVPVRVEPGLRRWRALCRRCLWLHAGHVRLGLLPGHHVHDPVGVGVRGFRRRLCRVWLERRLLLGGRSVPLWREPCLRLDPAVRPRELRDWPDLVDDAHHHSADSRLRDRGGVGLAASAVGPLWRPWRDRSHR